MKKKDRAANASNAGMIILWILLALQILLIFVCNLMYLPKYLDGDFAKLATHIVEMAENGRLAIPGWKYTTTAEWDCVTLFALPLYMITKNLYLSLSIGNLLISLMFAAVCFFIFNDKRSALVAANLLFIPYEFGILSYYNMLFYGGSQYSIKVIVPLLLIGVSLHAGKKAEGGKKDLPFIIASAALLFLLFVTTASSGVYVCICGIFPIVVSFIAYHVVNKKPIPRIWIILAACAIVLCGAGILLNRKVMGGTRADSLSFVTFYEYCDGYILRALAGFFSLFGGATVNGNVYITSTYGIFLFLRILFVLALIGGIIASVKSVAGSMSDRTGKCTAPSDNPGSAGTVALCESPENTTLRDLMMISAFFWNLLIILVADVRAGSPTFEYRYYLIGTIPAVLLLAERLTGIYDARKKNLKIPMIVCYLGFIFMMLFGCYRNITNIYNWEGDVHAEYRELVRYCEENGIDTVYIYDRSHETDICRLISSGPMFVDVLSNGYTWVNDYYESYEGPLPAEDCYVAVPAVSAVFEDGAPIFERQAEPVTSIGSIKLYVLKAE
ncbi:MAG: hypothetical protein K5871_12020 [Lachnospiraceae bacterium]|nr:hypothetical protein [Lachnospiraceae bacterium]